MLSMLPISLDFLCRGIQIFNFLFIELPIFCMRPFFHLKYLILENQLYTTHTFSRESLASFHDMKHAVSSLYLDEATGRMCTAGKDRVIKVWDVGVLLAPAPKPSTADQ